MASTPEPAAPPKQPTQAPPPVTQPPQGQAAEQQQQAPNLEYSPWTKVCFKESQQADAKQICRTAKDARLETGQPIVSIVLIEKDGEPKKLMQVLLPPGLLLQPGTRMIVDQGQPDAGPFVICFANFCMSQYEISQDFVGRLKKGQQIAIQAMNPNMQAVSFVIPLTDFAKANDGPPTDPKVFEEQQKKLQDELQRKADEARKRLLESQGAAGQPKQ